jgi:hypothetical protein
MSINKAIVAGNLVVTPKFGRCRPVRASRVFQSQLRRDSRIVTANSKSAPIELVERVCVPLGDTDVFR